MKPTVEERAGDRASAPARPVNMPWLHRVGWLVLIWAASVTALAVVAVLFRLVMNLAGLTAG